jgi:hypothetical protein
MNETIAQYTARIASYIEGKDPLVIQRQSPDTLALLIEGVPQEALIRERAPGRWSAREILAHLAEVEMVSTWRYRQMIEDSGVTLTSFDQDEWVRDSVTIAPRTRKNRSRSCVCCARRICRCSRGSRPKNGNALASIRSGGR